MADHCASDVQVRQGPTGRNGMEGRLIGAGELAEPKKVKMPRTPWEMLGTSLD